ncbi:ATP-binding cassette domain-containing protein [Actinospongicola halichondriae]|uniref:ATP-binding cassette domain-containing protein n=1 Tax=Actinospongicola halichondriae TaxID=3236844 RepID=UPI003D4B3B82
MSGAGLEASDITVRFGGHEALRGVDLVAPPGQVTGLIGPNGAGKTTLFNVLCGLQRTVDGEVALDGRSLTKLAPHQRARRGLARTFQRLETFTLLTVRENVLAGAEFRRRWAASDDPPSTIADELLTRLELDDVADERVDTLPTGRARLVELARALAAAPTMLLLDEPSSGLDERETEALGSVLREVADRGPGILLVEHDMALVMSVCDDLTVLDFGAVIASGAPDVVQSDPIVQQAYLGASTAERARVRPSRHDHAETDVVVAVDGLRAGYGGIDVLEGVDLDLHAGEVFAVVGPNGAGKTTLLGAISGLVPMSAGCVRILGHDVESASADELARAGLCLIPEGRGVFPNLTVAENLWLSTGTGVERRAIESAAYENFPRLAERRNQLAGTMSGGEQQMLAMARALGCDPGLLILDELSMGLAPIVVQSLYDEVQRLAQSGLTILVVEQFAHEILGVADRAAIMLHGRMGTPAPPDQIAERLADAYLSGTTA